MRVIAWPAYKLQHKNPYTALLYRNMSAEVEEFTPRKVLGSQCDIWHMHWPESFLNSRNAGKAAVKCAALLYLIDVARARGVKVVWTVHNLRAHDAAHPTLEHWWWKSYTKRVDAFISLSRTGIEKVRERFKALAAVPGFTVPHGHYIDAYPGTDSPRADARGALRIPQHSKVVLFFGAIRPYKNLEALITAFRRAGDARTMLLIAGQPYSAALANTVSTLARDDERVRCDFTHVPSTDVHKYFRAADLVILPYREIFNSGTAMLALSFARPVLVPAKGAMSELQASVGDEWVRTYSEGLTPQLITDSLRWATERRHADTPQLKAYDWPFLARQTVSVYEEVLSANVNLATHSHQLSA